MNAKPNVLLLSAGVLFLSIGCGQDPQIATDSNQRVPTTLRVDYDHVGTALDESFELDALIDEGEWPGSLEKTIDTLGYGPYAFEVRDATSGEVLYSRGFASIFGEWQTTGEARDTSLTFHETVRFPKPASPVDLVILKRDVSLTLDEMWRVRIDPSEARPAAVDPDLHVWSIIESGPPSEKVDILLLGDGYAATEMEKWHADAQGMADTLFSFEPFKGRRDAFNVRAIDTPAALSGIGRPAAGLTHETPIGATYDAFGMTRYILTFENRRWRDVAAAAPYEFVIISANNRKYGGAGIYNLFSTVAIDNEFTAYVLVHEFGHHFAGLGDEYYSSNVTYELNEQRPEPWSPNVTADPVNPKWKHSIDASTPLPTPWPKAEYDALQTRIQARRVALREVNAPEEDLEALFREQKRLSAAILSHATHAHDIGAFEGANYASTGYYRPEVNCIMFTRDAKGFCRVCASAINRMIDVYASK